MRIFKCVWCNHINGEPYKVCIAPDGDGHLYKPVEVKEKEKENGSKTNKRLP